MKGPQKGYFIGLKGYPNWPTVFAITPSRPQRIVEIANRYGLNGDEVLDNILLARAYTHEQQMDIITAAAAKIVEDESPYHLLVGSSK